MADDEPKRRPVRVQPPRTEDAAAVTRRPSQVAINDDHPIPDYLHDIALWERRMLWWGLLLPASPLLIALVGVPMQAVTVIGLEVVLIGVLAWAVLQWPAVILYASLSHKLAKAMGKSPWPWTIGSYVPYAGLLVVVVLNMQATSTLRAAGLKAPLFGPWRWAR